MDEIEEGTTEVLTWENFVQAIAGEETHGVPIGVAPPVQKRELVQGQDIHRECIRISFDFNVTCNVSPILSTSNDDDVKAHDIALLKQFLQTDKALELMVDTICSELGLNSAETFIQTFLPQIDTQQSRTLRQGHRRASW